jgi:hypothetical protein
MVIPPALRVLIAESRSFARILRFHGVRERIRRTVVLRQTRRYAHAIVHNPLADLFGTPRCENAFTVKGRFHDRRCLARAGLHTVSRRAN